MEIQLPSSIRSLDSQRSSPVGERDTEEELGRTAFLELMIAQISNQDPLEPAKNEAFIAQLAQFSSVEGIQNLNESMDGLVASLVGGRASDAANLVGRNVLVPTQQTALNTQGGIGGTLEVPEGSTNTQVDIFNAEGQRVFSANLPANGLGGEQRFNWDGQLPNGEFAPQGFYRVDAFADVEGQRLPLNTLLPDQVVSVSISEQGLVAHLAGGGSVPTTQIKEIR